MARVLISGTMEVSYSEIVEMEDVEFDRLNALLDEDDTAASELIKDYLDLNDPSDWSDFDVEDFRILHEKGA